MPWSVLLSILERAQVVVLPNEAEIETDLAKVSTSLQLSSGHQSLQCVTSAFSISTSNAYSYKREVKAVVVLGCSAEGR